MAGDIAVLLGPTLPVAEARTHLDAIYLPPAEQGSVFRAVVEHRPAVLAIIDGAFAQRPAVRHKEILWAHGERGRGARGRQHGGAQGGGARNLWHDRAWLRLPLVPAHAARRRRGGGGGDGAAGARLGGARRGAHQHAADAAPGRAPRGRRAAGARGARAAGPGAAFPRPQLWRDDRGRPARHGGSATCRDRRARRVAPRERGRRQARATPSASCATWPRRRAGGAAAAAGARSSSPRPGRRTWRRRGSGTIISHRAREELSTASG